jgi:hypothetical protein
LKSAEYCSRDVPQWLEQKSLPEPSACELEEPTWALDQQDANGGHRPEQKHWALLSGVSQNTPRAAIRELISVKGLQWPINMNCQLNLRK